VKLTQLEIAHMAGVAKSFGYDQETVEQVAKALVCIAENLPDAKTTVIGHTAYATEHFHNESVSPGSVSRVTGHTHLSLAVARLLLALRKGAK
jgi:hypothetical protein